MSVFQLPDALGSHLCTLSFWRAPDGKITCHLEAMPVPVIEATGTDVPSRIREVAKWVSQGAIDLLRQARAIDEQGHANDGQ